MVILVKENQTRADAKDIVKIIKDSIYKDFGIRSNQTYYNKASIKILYYHPVDFLTDEEYDAIPKDKLMEDASKLINKKMNEYLRKLPFPEDRIKDASVNWGYHGVFEIRIAR